ncbi:MAG TPA: DUF4265 domain-containing protein [Mucilaginibacter sp.]|jgi:hypothetical protein|nr:DUF4265 domain-containing protein [Mucilaginibacter sp.]
MNDSNNLVKILFRFYSDLLDKETAETMWAEVIDESKGLYKIDNIPFYAPLLASDDIVFAEYDEDEQMLTYQNTVEYSENSTVWVVIMDKTIQIEDVRKAFTDMGCISEKLSDGYFAMEIPKEINYKPIRQKLEELEKSDIIGYSEPSLSNKHQY